MREYNLSNPLDCVRMVARERYAWPGGYELCVVTSIDSTKKEISDGWRCIGISNESELEDDFCSECNKQLGYETC